MTCIVPSHEDLARVREMREKWPKLDCEVIAALAVENERKRVKASAVMACRDVGRSMRHSAEPPLVVAEKCANAVREVK